MPMRKPLNIYVSLSIRMQKRRSRRAVPLSRTTVRFLYRTRVPSTHPRQCGELSYISYGGARVLLSTYTKPIIFSGLRRCLTFQHTDIHTHTQNTLCGIMCLFIRYHFTSLHMSPPSKARPNANTQSTTKKFAMRAFNAKTLTLTHILTHTLRNSIA